MPIVITIRLVQLDGVALFGIQGGKTWLSFESEPWCKFGVDSNFANIDSISRSVSNHVIEKLTKYINRKMVGQRRKMFPLFWPHPNYNNMKRLFSGYGNSQDESLLHEEMKDELEKQNIFENQSQLRFKIQRAEEIELEIPKVLTKIIPSLLPFFSFSLLLLKVKSLLKILTLPTSSSLDFHVLQEDSTGETLLRSFVQSIHYKYGDETMPKFAALLNVRLLYI